MEKISGLSQGSAEPILNPAFIHENLLLLRRRLMLSQGEFISKYLSDESGKPLLSVAKLSNIETKGGKDALKYAEMISRQLSVDPSLFHLTPDAFAKNIEVFIENQLHNTASGNLSDLAHRIQKTGYVETLVRIMCDYLTDNLISGDLRPGDKLPSDRNLSIMFGVGRTAVREALKVLSVLGLVRILPGQGTFVASKSASFFMAPLSWTFLLGEHNLENILTVRSMLEDTSARLAAEKATEADLEETASIISAAEDAFSNYNFQKFLEYDINFHLSIAKGSHNQIIHELLLTSRKLITHISKSGLLSVEDLMSVSSEHIAIFQAIKDRNPSAAQEAMALHMEKSHKRYKLC
ncbi:FadR/GntR family transcriptional regulator [Lachnospiraceae bacterium 62-35]